MEAVATILGASAAVTKLVDLTRNLLKDDGLKYPKWLWNAVALGYGILGALMFRIEPPQLPETLRFDVTGVPLQLLTGFVIAGFAGGFHELFDMFSSKAKAIRARNGI